MSHPLGATSRCASTGWSFLTSSVLFATLCFAGCNSDNKLAGPEPGPAGPPAGLQGSAIRLDIDLTAGRVTVQEPSLAVSNRAGLHPSFSLLGRTEIGASITNLTRSAVGAFTPGRSRVRFDLALTNKIQNVDLVPATFPAPPPGVAQIVAFPFATDPAGLFGLNVIASNDWDGTGDADKTA